MGQKALVKREDINVDFGDIPALTKQLLQKVNSLNELESRFLASPRLSNCEDLSELIITCLTVLDNLVTSVTEEPSKQGNVRANNNARAQKRRNLCPAVGGAGGDKPKNPLLSAIPGTK